ncbi:MAG: DUF3395 domain-containing protein, partial [Kiritimatiellales bacterium]|nr:DUF3395 domain-containing protein [Kiritimatiellales bacterium]
GQWGTHFDRTCTWWEQGRAWMQYIARSQFMLQQGRFVADAAAFCGESAPVQMPAINSELPSGYDYDGINADVLLNHASVEDGQLVLDSGMRYRVLSLSQPDRTMTPKLLRKLRDFVAAGLTVIGPPPVESPSLDGYPKCDEEVKALVDEMWGNCDGKTVTEHRLGKGLVVWGQPMEQVFATLDVKPDFEFPAENGSKLVFIHRLDGDADIYFVSNQRAVFDFVECTFRVAGKVPELWHSDSGRIEDAPVWHEEGGRITVPLQFDPAGSVFVVFRKPANADHIVSAQYTATTPTVPPSVQELAILKAEYGVLFNPSTESADITDAVQRLIKTGNRHIVATNKLAGDPAPGTLKELRIECRGAPTIIVAEGGTAVVPDGAEVVRAFYGAPGSTQPEDGKQADITARLAGLVKDGRLTVKADNTLAGGDPAPMSKKELLVEYRYLGLQRTVRVAENSMLSLPEEGLDTEPSAYELAMNNSGKPICRAWEPGTIEVQTAAGRTLTANVADVPQSIDLSGPWTLNFPPNWGAPAAVELPKLISWTDHADSDVKYFSGTATYARNVEIPPEMFGNGRSLWLDLGLVKNLAEVSVNGTPLGILWKPPFRADITTAAKPGRNRLEIKITNLWPNRLVGDEQLPPDCDWLPNLALKDWPQWLLDGKPSPTGRLTFTTWHHWKTDDALLPSGLLGPVTLRASTDVVLKP